MYNSLPFLAYWIFVHDIDGRIVIDNRPVDMMMELFHNSEYGPVDITDLNCKLRGKVYRRPGFRDGDIIETSQVKTIQISNTGFVATTRSGSQYDVKNPNHTLLFFQ